MSRTKNTPIAEMPPEGSPKIGERLAADAAASASDPAQNPPQASTNTRPPRPKPTDPQRPPEHWLVTIVGVWPPLHRAHLEYRAGARGPFVPVEDSECYVPEPKGAPSSAEPAELARELWRKAHAHCDENGGPIDYRLVLQDGAGKTLAATTRASRLDTTSPDGKVRALVDDDTSPAALLRAMREWSEHQTRALVLRDKHFTELAAAIPQMFGAVATALTSITDAARAQALGEAERIKAQGEVDLAKAEFTREMHAEQQERDDAADASADRRERFWAWLENHGDPIATSIGKAIETFSTQATTKTEGATENESQQSQ